MPRLVLFGDSVIDNAAYVEADEPDVAAQLRTRLPEWEVVQRARDGFVTADVLEDLFANPPPDEALVFLSSGGNDALAEMPRLADPQPLTLAEAMVTLAETRERFRRSYARVLDGLGRHRLLVATIYNPHFTGPEAALQVAGEGGLSAFNDVIQQEAIARRVPVLDLRRLFNDPADYANAIEPSAVGGAKIADAVAAWAVPE